MYSSKISEELQRKLGKLSVKNKPLYEQVLKKIREIITSADVEHYKNLRYNMKDSKRAHIGHFVLIFQYDQKSNIISFDDFDHHDEIYSR
ncbi:type II toxin-antitoxin system RelE/ParE family toxin [Candidatus Woesearchaeota archaeon]|nr:type II toxin-antitoxin system RelE/ParE family toxin [Candidatus Woesearchaeota archaeon]